MKGIRIGIKVEKEHAPTYKFLVKYAKAHKGKLPPATTFYKKIASNHLAEHKNYYTKLRSLKL